MQFFVKKRRRLSRCMFVMLLLFLTLVYLWRGRGSCGMEVQEAVGAPFAVETQSGGKSIFSERGGAVTVVMMSHPGTKRLHLLTSTLKKMLWDWPKGEGLVHEVLLVWNGAEETIPSELRAFRAAYKAERPPSHEGESHVPDFRILPQSSNSLANRWLVGPLLQTDAVLNLDDDIHLPYASLRCMLFVWRSIPSALVTVDARAVVDCTPKMLRCRDLGLFSYAARDALNGYNLALPRALVSSSVYYTMFAEAYSRVVRFPSRNAFSQAAPQATPLEEDSLERVIAELLCDDIAFNFAAANLSREMAVKSSFQPRYNRPLQASPLLVSVPFVSFPESNGAGALTKQQGMKAKRRHCANRLSLLFSPDGGRTPFRLPSRRWQGKCPLKP